MYLYPPWCTHPPVPLPTCTPTRLTPTTPGTRSPGYREAGSTAAGRAKNVHQAQYSKMEILSNWPNLSPVQLTQLAGPRYRDYFPGCQKHTVFNNEKYKTYYFYLKAKGLFTRNSSKHEKTAKTRIARKPVHRKLPFESRIKRPNSTPRSGSLGTCHVDPAPVRVSSSDTGVNLAVLAVFLLFIDLCWPGLITRGFSQ